MDATLRAKFNAAFTEKAYETYLKEIDALAPETLGFRVAETPIFVPKDFTKKMLDAGEAIIDVITAPNFKALTERSIPSNFNVPGEDDHTQFLVLDFGICRNTDGQLEPQLIEMQGFPTLFAFQAAHTAITATYAQVPANFNAYLNGYNETSYNDALKDIIVGDLDAAEVILLEIYPDEQKTKIDFCCTSSLLGIQTVCLTKLRADGSQLYYEKNGAKQIVKRIYNRLIFDDLDSQTDVVHHLDFSKNYDVQWVPHPNWFYRISKYTLPFIQHPYVPETFFLNEVVAPLQLQNYVLKPLFSFAGMGVVIDVTQEDIDKIKDPENWILQKKVMYDPIIATLDEPAKAEIRLFYFWKDEWERPVAVHNLARLSKGKMIGTRYNKDKTWVGGTVAYFEQ